MNLMTTRIVFAAIVLTTIVSASAVVDRQSQGVEPTPSAAPSDGGISAPGLVEGATEEVAMRPEVRGLVAERPVGVGDHVRRGELLLRMDDRAAQLTLQAAIAEHASSLAERERLINGARDQERDEARALLRAVEARLERAQKTLARVEHLETANAVAAQEADDARSDADTLLAEYAAAQARTHLLEAPAREDEVRLADARVAAAEAAVQSARVALDKTKLRAPMDSQVVDVAAEVGELIGPSSATPVIVLSDTSSTRVRAFVEELDAPRVELGSAVEISADGLPDQVFEGVVSGLSPRMITKETFSDRPSELYDTKVREVLIDVVTESPLLLGLRVDVRLTNEQ